MIKNIGIEIGWLCYANVIFLNYTSHPLGKCIDCSIESHDAHKMGALVTERGDLVILISNSHLEIRQLPEIIKMLE